MTTATRRPFCVRIDRPDGEYGIGPFVVLAKSPRGAFRKVRLGWGHMINSYDRTERHTMSCEGAVSDRRGLVLNPGMRRGAYA